MPLNPREERYREDDRRPDGEFRQADIINWLTMALFLTRQRRPWHLILKDIERIEDKEFADEISRLAERGARRVKDVLGER